MYDNQQQTTNTELQAPDFGQVGGKLVDVAGYLYIPTTKRP